MSIQSRFRHITVLGFLVVLFSACAAVDISLLPMYGGAEKTQQQLQADAAYLKQMDAYFANRREGSDSAARAGWNFWYQGDWQIAMRRFNQSWLLDPDNYNPYWGFVVLLGAQGKYRESSDMGDIALGLAPDNPRLMCDVAHSNVVYASTLTAFGTEREKTFHKALALCEKAATIAPDEPCQAWAITLFFLGQYQASWEKIKQREELGQRYPQDFLDELERKLPRP